MSNCPRHHHCCSGVIHPYHHHHPGNGFCNTFKPFVLGVMPVTVQYHTIPYHMVYHTIPYNTIQIIHTTHAIPTTHYTFHTNFQTIQIMPVTELPLPTNAYPRCLIVIVIVIIIITMVIKMIINHGELFCQEPKRHYEDHSLQQ